MIRGTSILFLLLAIQGCSSTDVHPPPPPWVGAAPVATVTVKTVDPTPGTVVNPRSVIDAEIEYSITSFDRSQELYLVPLFDSTESKIVTFNSYQRITDALRITAPSGTAHVRYAIGREWHSGRLAMPVRVRFSLMVRTGAHSTIVIGKSETLEFVTAGTARRRNPASSLSAELSSAPCTSARAQRAARSKRQSRAVDGADLIEVRISRPPDKR